MIRRELGVQGVGVVTDSIGDMRELWAKHAHPPHRPFPEHGTRCEVLDPSIVESHDVLTQLTMRAVHQAWTMAGLAAGDGDRVGLIFQSAWGMIDATAAYLESMLAERGKYASPRHFSRSVYSSVASVTAIHFGIRGPCETLSFESERLAGPLCQAWRLLAARRCDQVVVAWGEQGGEVAEDLTKRAVEKLARREFRRYVERGVGSGAVAVVLGRDGKLGKIDIEDVRRLEGRAVEGQKPFAMDSAVGLAAHLLSGAGA